MGDLAGKPTYFPEKILRSTHDQENYKGWKFNNAKSLKDIKEMSYVLDGKTYMTCQPKTTTI